MRADAPPWVQPRQLVGAELHVWAFDLGGLAGAAAADTAPDLLDRAELERAARLHHARDRTRWVGSRVLLRRLLGGYLQVDPASLRLQPDERGKPRLAPSTRAQRRRCSAPPLQFNLSHSGDFVLVALTRDQPVGVDVELAGREVDSLALAKRTFGVESVRRLSGFAASDRNREFLRMWVRHEAALKCSGTGLTGTEGVASPECPWVAELDLDDRLLAAVAAMREPAELVCSRLEAVTW